MHAQQPVDPILTKPAKEPAPWPDRIRNLATFMVVLIHASAPVAHGEGSDFNGLWWWGGNFWNSLTRPGVPLFVMLSGYLLLGKDYPLPVFLKRRFSRVVIPAVFWMLVYSLYGYLAKGSPASIGAALKGIVTGPVHYHFWFIYLIIGLYLVYPILRPWVRSATDRDFYYFFALSALGTWGYKFLATFYQIHLGVYFELFTNNCGYFVLGYFLGNRVLLREDTSPAIEPAFRIHRHTPLLLVVLGTLGTMVASYVLNTFFATGKTQVFFYDYLTPNVAISAIGWFLLAKTAFNHKPLLDIERDFTAASFGIYFAHVLVMDLWGRMGYWHSMTYPMVVAPLLATMIASLTFLAISLIRVLPGGQRIT